ncbi:MAG: hypothetical protein GTO02_17210, partial [Candidatus Dadabacteria bacterium]|nr:hypothetical protein [Candidatus Dadabacteria bacterium]
MVLGFPRKSISEVMRIANVKPDDIDYIAVATKKQHHIDKYVDYREGKFEYKKGIAKKLLFRVGSVLSKFVNKFPFIENLYYQSRSPFYSYRKNRVKKILIEEFNFSCPIE